MNGMGYNSMELFFECGVHLPSRTLMLEAENTGEGCYELTYDTYTQFIKGLFLLEKQSDKPIEVLLNCAGGSVVDGFAIYDEIKNCNSHVTIKVLGEASSMGSVVLQAADLRVMAPHSILMLHDGSVTLSGVYRDVERGAEDLKRDREQTYQIFEERTGKKKSYWRRKLSNDWYLTPEQALEEKLIDKIV